MSVKLHEAFSLDSFQDRLLWFDDFHGDQLQDEWNSTGDVGGSAVVVDAQTGGIVRITTNNVDTEDWRIDWADIHSLLVSKKVTMEIRVKVNDATNREVYIRLQFDNANRVMFWNTGQANWQLQTRDGGVATSPDSGIAISTNYVILRIECFPTGEVHFYIDGTETANSPITTNIPDDAADYLQPYLLLIAGENVAKTMDVDYVYLREER